MISFYPLGLATLRPIDGANVAILTMKTEHLRHKMGFILSYFVLFYPSFVLICLILQFDTFDILATFTPSSVTSPENKMLYIPLIQKG